VWKKTFHGVENFWRKGGRRAEFFHGVEIIFPWRGKAGLELAEGEVAVDFIDGAVAVYVQDGVGEGGGEFFAQAADDFGFEFFADAGGDGVEGGDAGLDDVAGAVLRADADGEGGANVEEAVVFAVGGVAVGGTVGVAAGAVAVEVFEFDVNFIEYFFQAGFPAFESGLVGGHGGAGVSDGSRMLPGLRRVSGSRIFFSARMRARAASPAICRKRSRLILPMPCSAEMLPPQAMTCAAQRV